MARLDRYLFDGRSASALILVGTTKLLGVSGCENRDPGISCLVFSSGLQYWAQVTVHQPQLSFRAIA